MELVNLNFSSLEPIVLPVKIGSEDYLLREASENAASNYQDAQTKAMKLGPDGKPAGFDGLAKANSVLVAGCLFKVIETKVNGEPVKKEMPVSVNDIQRMPHRIVDALIKEAKRISNIEVETVETLTQQIKTLQERLDTLRKQESQEIVGHPKNTLTATPDTSS